MGDPRLIAGGGGDRRQWSFADCVFDESSWTLTVRGRRVALESKPMEILRQLLLHPGQVVSKAELLDRIWPGIAVVEASLPTAVHKLRTALGDDSGDRAIVETVPRIGYRLATHVDVSCGPMEAPKPVLFRRPSDTGLSRTWRLAAIALVTAFVASVTLAFGMLRFGAESRPVAQPTMPVVDRALRLLDVEQIEAFIATGWDVNMAMDADRNTPLNRLLDMCEWDPAHDRRRMLLMARTLIDGGTRLADRNSFGDTPYSIAKAPRFCGPDHPVTVMLKRLCYNGGAVNRYGDRCLASYELARRAARN